MRIARKKLLTIGGLCYPSGQMLPGTIQRAFFAGLTCACGVMPAAAENVSKVPLDQRFHVVRWTTDQGLPQNRISCLKQTRDGYLWLGTWFGLARFDGIRFTVFDRSNTPELEDNTINALAEDNDGTLWIATFNGLVRYRDHHFDRLTTVDGLPHPVVTWIAPCRFGGLWVQAGPDLMARFQGGKFSPSGKLPPSQEGVRAFHEGAGGVLQIFLENTWLTLSATATQPEVVQITNSFASYWKAALASKHPGRAWLSTISELTRWEPGALKHYAAEEFGLSPSEWPVDFMFEDRATNLWVNLLPGRLFHEQGDGWAEVDLGEGDVPSSIFCMEQDPHGDFWMGTDNGLVQLRSRQARTFTTREGLTSDQVWTVCEGTDGTIWLGTRSGLSRIQNGQVTPLPASDQVADEVRTVCPAPTGGLRFATRIHGIYELTGKPHLLVPTNDLPNRKVSALYKDRSGRLWVGTAAGVAVLTNGKVTTSYTNWAGRSGYDVRCILEDRSGAFWFGTEGQGLTRLKEGQLDVFTERHGLSSPEVWAIHEDAEGALWLGTENGLTRFQAGRFFPFSRKHGLLENSVNWILEDDFGFLWLSGLRGIYRVKREQLKAVAEGRANWSEVAMFGTDEGMESNETNGENQPAGCKARDGRVWFPTTRGIVVFDPKTIESGDVPLPVIIEQMKADDEVVFGDGARGAAPSNQANAAAITPPAAPSTRESHSLPILHFPPGRAQSVEIVYTANVFAHAQRIQFRYRLIGRDSDWREQTTDRVAHYTNLRPGEYRFEVMAANHRGVWSPQPARLSFSIAPHYYETWSFYVLCGVAAVGLVAAIQSYRLRWQHRVLKLEQESAIALERTRIARDLHDDLGTALTGLALELDIVRRDAAALPKVAEHVGKTSRLTRELVERVREAVWSVNPKCDTVSSLASYLEQQIGQFLRATDTRVTLDFPEDIPAMPLAAEARHQLALSVREALANAVRHANAAEVAVSLSIAGEHLVVQVKDNGRGFESQSQRGHGLENLRARLAQIGGRFDCVSQPGAGTVVEFRVPLRPSVLRKKPAQ